MRALAGASLPRRLLPRKPDPSPNLPAAGIKPLAGSDGQRFRLLLSDGQHMHPVLLTGAPGALAAGGGLVSGSLVRLLGYQTSLVQGHK